MPTGSQNINFRSELTSINSLIMREVKCLQLYTWIHEADAETNVTYKYVFIPYPFKTLPEQIKAIIHV